MNTMLAAIGFAPGWLLPGIFALPLVGSIAVWLLPRAAGDTDARLARTITIGLLSVTAILTLALWLVVPNGSTEQVDYPWIDEFGARIRFAATGISLPMIVLTAWLMLLSVIATDRAAITHRAVSYYALILLLTAGILGIFLAADLLLFYLCWELMLVPLYFLIGVWGSGRGPAAGTTFFIYTMLGSLLMLVAVIVVASAAGGTTYDTVRTMATNQPMSMTAQAFCFFAFAAAFLVKSALIPFHTWLPDAQSEGPPIAAVALGIKVGTYGLMVLAYPLFPSAALHPVTRMILASLGVVGVLYGSLVALVQPDFRRVISYASIAHLGFVVVGISAFTAESLQGAVIVMVNAGITTGGMFLLLGMLRKRISDDRFQSLGGLAKDMPMFGALVVLFALANAGLPGTNGFVGEFLVLIGSFTHFPVLVLLATIGVILAAAYLLWAVQRMLFGQRPDGAPVARDLNGLEAGVMAAFVLAIIGLGLAPAPVLDRLDDSVASLVTRVNMSAITAPPTASAVEDAAR
ncbi:MAG: NADH-quinone oxidoreductase subunit M [Gemmatimonadaceae bacterium]|nr:NADH-quinone oxidoreductase subunit M [Gemmatimonadaceae bacterium]